MYNRGLYISADHQITLCIKNLVGMYESSFLVYKLRLHSLRSLYRPRCKSLYKELKIPINLKVLRCIISDLSLIKNGSGEATMMGTFPQCPSF